MAAIYRVRRWTICNRWRRAAERQRVCGVNVEIIAVDGITVRIQQRGSTVIIIQIPRKERRGGRRCPDNLCVLWKGKVSRTRGGRAEGPVPGPPGGRSPGLLVLLLVPHPAVLEPDLNLPVGELQGGRHVQPPRAGEVGAEVELLLQLQQLAAAEGRPLPPQADAPSSLAAGRTEHRPRYKHTQGGKRRVSSVVKGRGRTRVYTGSVPRDGSRSRQPINAKMK